MSKECKHEWKTGWLDNNHAGEYCARCGVERRTNASSTQLDYDALIARARKEGRKEEADALEHAMAEIDVLRSETGAHEQEPVAWRYRYKNGDRVSEWRYVEKAEYCNPSEDYEREPLYPMKWSDR